MYLFLRSYAQGISERGLAIGLFLCVTCIFGCWYFCFFRSRLLEMHLLQEQSIMLAKRIGSLKKSIKRSDQVSKELSLRSRSLERQKRFQSLSEALSSSLQALHSCGVRMVNCKMQAKKDFLFGVGQMVSCELYGSYESLSKMVASASIAWKECRIILNAEGLYFSGIFWIYALRSR